MIKHRLYIVPIVALLFAACFNNTGKSQKPNITRDTLTYTYQTIKQTADDCTGKPDSLCSMALIKYPQFTDQSALNDTLAQNMVKLFNADPDKGLQTTAKRFIASYDGWRKSHKNIPQYFKLNLSAKVLRQDSSYITVQIDGISLAGNKHAIALTKFVNWNTKSQAHILLDSILTNGYEQPLTAIAEKIFRKQENLSDTASLVRDYFFKGGKFSLNNNYALTPIGIRFFYNEYEIKPFNAGVTDLFIPYTQIKSLIKPHTVLDRYVKN